MTGRTELLLAGSSGLLAVMLGAFGAHALKASLTPALYAAYQTGIEYQFYHTLALLLVGMLRQQQDLPYLLWAGRAFVAGILLFSGSLYLLALSGVKVFGMVTPVGGVLFMVGWAMLILAGYCSHRGTKDAD